MISANYTQSYKNLINKPPTTSSRFIFHSQIFSQNLPPSRNDTTTSAPYANYPDTDRGIYLLSLDGFLEPDDEDGTIITIAPVDKPSMPLVDILKELQEPPNPNRLGIIGNIHEFDITLLLIPDRILDGFIAANMTITKNLLDPTEIVSAIPNGSATLITEADFWKERIRIGKILVNQIKNLPPFNTIIEDDPAWTDEKRSLAAGKFLIDNHLLPKFYIPKIPNFTQNSIKELYCKYDQVTGELIEEQCGLAEHHEIATMLTTGNPLGNLGMGTYSLKTYPLIVLDAIDPNLDRLCAKCSRWVLNCAPNNLNEVLLGNDTDDRVVIQPYQEEDIEKYTLAKLYYNYDEAKEELEKQLDIPENQYGVFFIDNDCVSVHPFCFTHKNWNTIYPPALYPKFDSLEDCLDTLRYVVVCNNTLDLSIQVEKVFNAQDLQNLENKYNDLPQPSAYRIFETKEAAEDFKDNIDSLVYFAENNDSECELIHTLCAEALGLVTYVTLESCQERNDFLDSGSGLSGGSVLGINIEKSWIFNEHNGRWEKS